MSTPASRLINLILLLQREPNQKASDLAEKLGISVRTIHRYFGMLDEMGIPIYSERGPYGGFSLVRGYKLPPLVFTPQEAAALYLGINLVGQMWGQLYKDAAHGAMIKLDNVIPDEQLAEVAWAQRSLVVMGMHRTDPTSLAPTLETIRVGLRQGQQIKMLYQGSTSTEAAGRRVDPYTLAFRSGWWYLAGYCHLRQDLRVFRVDRIREIELLGEVFQIPADFDARAYLEKTFRDQPSVEARLRFSPQAAHIAISNLALWDSHQENPDGSVDAVLSAPDLNWLGSFVLSFATWVTVLDPPELRTLIREWALGTAALYQDDIV